MMFLRNALFIVAFFICGSNLNAQTITQPDLNKSLIPPSPDVASLGKYGILPVTLYEGQPNTSIPVYEIKSSKLSLPISLGYNYNGYRPGEEASWIGLGWNLQAGGVITRVVKGQVDDSCLNNQWKDYANILDLTLDQSFLELAAARLVDTEPDIYIFNFNGHSGKFITVGERVFTFPHQDLQITRMGNGFRIVTEDGVIYNFYTTEITTPSNSIYFTTPFTSAWYLTSINSPDYTDEIDFQYTDWGHRIYNSNYTQIYHQQVGGTQNGQPCNGSGACDSWSIQNFPGAFISAKRLTKIISKNTIVNFIPESSIRQDLNSPTAYALKEINVYSLPDTILFKKMEFVHEYFAYNALLKLKSLNLSGYYGNNSSTNPNISMPGYYSFEYANETTGDYLKSTTGIDKWGYYNGKNNNVMLFDANFLGYPPIQSPGDRSVDFTKSINGTLTKISYPTGGYTTIDYEPNEFKAINQQPYEQNLQTSSTVFYDGVHNPTVSGGYFIINEEQDINITISRTIASNWVHNDTLILKIYIPGNDDNPPIPPVVIYTSPRMGPSALSSQDVFHIMPGTYIFSVRCGSEALSASALIQYKKLITPPAQGFTQLGAGVRVKEIKSYDFVNLTTPASTKTYSYSPGINLSYGDTYSISTTQHHKIICNNGAGSEIYDENVYTSNYSSPTASLLSSQFYYPTVTEINHDSSGSGKTVYEYVGDGFSANGVYLKKQSEYIYTPSTSNTLLIKQKTNTYTEKSGTNFWGFTYNLSDMNDPCPVPCCMLGLAPLVSTDVLDPISRDKIYHATPYALTSDCMQLSTSEEINYQKDGTNPQTLNTDYYYDNSNYLMPSRTVVTNSKGEIITTQVKYPYDCVATSTCNFPSWRENAFRVKRDEASLAYQNCMLARYNECFPYWIPGVQNSFNALLMQHLNNYHCRENYPNQFASALASINSMPCPGQSGYGDLGTFIMQGTHVINTPVEQIISLNKSGNEYLLSANRTEFTSIGGTKVSPKTIFQTKLSSSSVLKADYLNNSTYYLKPRVNFVSDINNNIIEQSKVNDIKISYLWDYKNSEVIAQCTNTDKDNIFYTSFEADGKGGFIYSGMVQDDATAPTGRKIYLLNNTVNSEISVNTDVSKQYILSLWAKAGNVTVNNSTPIKTGKTIGNWTYYEYKSDFQSSITVRGNTSIDELRLYPKDGLMTTYTYEPLLGLTSQCDPNNHFSYFEYDALGRLLLIRNEDRNIIKQYQYNYDTWSADNQPNWIATGLTQCKPCPTNSIYLSNILQQQERDINTHSPTYNQYRWTDAGPSPICDANAAWQNVIPPVYRCVINLFNNQNTGEQEQKQQDMNPCSMSYTQYRWVNIGLNTSACPLPSTCVNCTAPDKKCINNICETGTKVYTSSVYNTKSGNWICTYHYHWSDGSNSSDYTETSATNCMTGGGIDG